MRKISRFIGKIVLYFVLWSIASVLGYRFLPVHFTPLMGIRVMEQLVDGEKPKVSHRWPYSQVSDNIGVRCLLRRIGVSSITTVLT